jgi:hypothetical protein
MDTQYTLSERVEVLEINFCLTLLVYVYPSLQFSSYSSAK